MKGALRHKHPHLAPFFSVSSAPAVSAVVNQARTWIGPFPANGTWTCPSVPPVSSVVNRARTPLLRTTAPEARPR
jgi:hypothetical protein